MSCTSRSDELIATARAMTAPGKGLLAADESTATIGKRLAGINLPNTEQNRRTLRELLFTSPGIEQYISGVILYEETLFQTGADGTPLIQQLTSRGVLPGIKVDVGVAPLPGSPSETFTMGLDKLKERCDRFYAAGARFAKWRAVINIAGSAIPSDAAVQTNAVALAMYAAVSQAAGLVPIVEPEVLADGSHSLARCEAVTARVLAAVFKELHTSGVLLEGMVLKPNMITPGSEAPRASIEEVAAATVRVLRRTVPPAVPGVMFLSGGQSEEDATRHLAAMNALPDVKPWSLSFSYGRALQASALKAWKGRSESVGDAQEAFLVRARANSEASVAPAAAA